MTRTRNTLYAVVGGVGALAVAIWYSSAETAVESRLDLPSVSVAASKAERPATGALAELLNKPEGLQTINPALAARISRMNPALDVLSPEAWGGHLSYGKAMILAGCKDFFEQRAEFGEVLATVKKFEDSGEPSFKGISDELVYRQRVTEVQCQSFTQQDVQNVTLLMREAAAAGDERARTWLLQGDFSEFHTKAVESLDNKDKLDVLARGNELLREATDLARRGDPSAAFVAAQLTSTEAYGQKDLVASAAWTFLSQQTPGTPFQGKGLKAYQQQDYASLSDQQRALAVELAQKMFSSWKLPETSQNAMAPPPQKGGG